MQDCADVIGWNFAVCSKRNKLACVPAAGPCAMEQLFPSFHEESIFLDGFRPRARDGHAVQIVEDCERQPFHDLVPAANRPATSSRTRRPAV